MQEVTAESVSLAYVDQGYSGEDAEVDAASRDPPGGGEAPPRRSGASSCCRGGRSVERSFAWMSRFRRLALDYERLTTVLAGMHYVAFSLLMLHKAAPCSTGVHNTL